MPIYRFAFVALMALSLWMTDAHAQNVSQTAQNFAGGVARACLDDAWESPACLRALSESNLTMAGNYAGALQQAGKGAAADKIKEHCAASTAARQQEFPAYAMKSAFIECANMISDIAESTAILPDQSQYQLLVGAVLCMEKDRRCTDINQGLRRYK